MRSRSTLRDDDRAIEGLPMRLIIALVVGVASLTLMMNMLGGFGGGLQKAEISADTSKEVVDMSDATGKSDSTDIITLTIEDDSGEKVKGATVIIKSGKASVNSGTATFKDGDNDGEITIEAKFFKNDVSLNGQDQGDLQIQVLTPDDGNYKNSEGDGVITLVS